MKQFRRRSDGRVYNVKKKDYKTFNNNRYEIYEHVELDDSSDPSATSEGGLEDLTAKELQELAKKSGIENVSRLKKSELIALIEEAS